MYNFFLMFMFPEKPESLLGHKGKEEQAVKSHAKCKLLEILVHKITIIAKAQLNLTGKTPNPCVWSRIFAPPTVNLPG